MPRLKGPEQPAQPPDDNGGLSLRWAFIIAAATGFGILVNAVAGPVPAFTLALVLTGLLHSILPKRDK